MQGYRVLTSMFKDLYCATPFGVDYGEDGVSTLYDPLRGHHLYLIR